MSFIVFFKVVKLIIKLISNFCFKEFVNIPIRETKPDLNILKSQDYSKKNLEPRPITTTLPQLNKSVL